MTALALVQPPDLEPVAEPGDPCIQCGGERRLPKGLHRVHAAVDPFCSSDCCRVWYGLGSEDHSTERAKFRKRSYVG